MNNDQPQMAARAYREQETANCVGPQPIPHPISPNKIYDINITAVDHGFVCRVGCKTLVVETKSKLIALFSEYITDPETAQNKLNIGKLF